MKRTLLAASISMATLFSTSGHADIIKYIETGNDNLGDSFSLTFQYDNVANTILSATAASFTDPSGTYTGLPSTPIVYGNGFTGFEFIDSTHNTNPALLAIVLNNNPIPLVNSTPGFYAATLSPTGIYITYNNAPAIKDAPVPLPGAIWLFSAGIAGLLGLRHRVLGKHKG